MAALNDAQILAKVKNGLGITTNYMDDTLNIYIGEVKAFMVSAGVDETVVSTDIAVGCILQGVTDLWTYGAGTAKLSDYFKMRLVQLAAITPTT